MKRRLYKTLGLVVILCITGSLGNLKAIDFRGGINWDMGSPIGKYTQFTDQFSLRGGSIWVDLNIIPRLAVGVDLGIHQFYQNNPRATYYPQFGQAFTAHTYNCLTDIPIMAHLKFFIVARGLVRPYIGMGFGANRLKKEILFSDMVMTEKSWSYTMAPTFGLQINFGKYIPVGLNIFARYGVSFDKFTYNQKEINTYQYWNVGIGLLFN